MRLLVKKALVVLLCIPLYPFVMFAEWYDKATQYGAKFILRKANSEYWSDVKDAITYRKEGR